MSVKIIVDSASDISKTEAEALGLIMLPMIVSFKGEDYFDGETLLPKQFYEKLIESDSLPKTSQISPFRFEEAYEDVVKGGDECVVITISSKLSGTYLSAKQAAENFKDKVFVVDSLNACVGERLLVQYALRLKEEGLSASEIAEKLNEQKGRINVMAMLDTLEYLKKGGRISSAVALVGEMLSLKPVIAVADGEVKMIGKARGSKNGNNLLNSLVERRGGIDFSMPYGVVYSGLNNDVLKKYLRDSAKLYNEDTSVIPEYIIGCTIGTHVGPNAIGVAFFANAPAEEV